MKKFIKHLGFPFAILGFILVGWVVIPYLDKTSATYDLSFLHAFFAAITICLGITAITAFGLYFNFHDLYTTMYSGDSRREFAKLPYLTRLYVALYVFTLVFISTITLYAIFV